MPFKFNINGTVRPGSTATAYSGTIFFGGKNVNFYEGSVLEIRARQCALQSYDGCTSIAGIATLNMNGIIRVTVTDDNKLAAGDSIRIWHAEAMTGTPVLELPAAFVWDTSRLSEGLLFVVSVDEGISTVLTPRHESGDIYDIRGRLVRKEGTSTQGLAPGVYIRNGRKFVVK